MCKNHKHSYMPIIDKQSQIMSELPLNCYKENKIPRNTTYKKCKGPLQGNKRGHKQMEKHSMLMEKKNEYRENGYTTLSNL